METSKHSKFPKRLHKMNTGVCKEEKTPNITTGNRFCNF